MATQWNLIVCVICLSLTMASVASAQGTTGTIQLKNSCSFPLWPAIASSDDLPGQIPTMLNAGDTDSLTLNSVWSGEIWGRQGCVFDQSGTGQCDSGDCGGNLRCDHAGESPQVPFPSAITKATFTNGLIAVSLESGYNIPISLQASANNGPNCTSMACTADVASVCPTNLQVTKKGSVIGCNGSCNLYQSVCSPPAFSSAFQKACPQVLPFKEQSYCSGTVSYTLTFCG